MTFLEVCQQVINKKPSETDCNFYYWIWRESWHQDTFLEMNEKRDAYASSPSVSIFSSSFTSRPIVFSLTKTEKISYVGWLPSVGDLEATDWKNNTPENTSQV
jgi:hypothetical protein